MATSKLKTGIPGLDNILKGGFLGNSAVLISGGPGTGKSLMGMQFLVEGAKNKEPGLCILYDTEAEEFLNYADSLGIPVREYEKKGLITILKEPVVVRRVAPLASPVSLIKQKNIRRVVLDSLTMFSYLHVLDDRDYRMKILDFLRAMKNVTLLATAEASASNLDEANFKAEDFLFDGLIFLTKVRQDAAFERVLHVSKMRGQDHLMNVYPFSIEMGGVKVYPDQLPFALMKGDYISTKNNRK